MELKSETITSKKGGKTGGEFQKLNSKKERHYLMGEWCNCGKGGLAKLQVRFNSLENVGRNACSIGRSLSWHCRGIGWY